MVDVDLDKRMEPKLTEESEQLAVPSSAGLSIGRTLAQLWKACLITEMRESGGEALLAVCRRV